MSGLGDRQVVVLAGGLGSRLGSLGGRLPKALRPVGGRPFLDVMLAPFLDQGLHRLHFCLGHGGEQLALHLARLDPAFEVTTVSERRPSGTAGALLRSIGCLDEVFLLTMGDTYIELPCGPLFEALPEAADGLLVVSDADSGVTPNVALEGGSVVGYDKRGVAGGLTDTGVAVLRRRALTVLDEESPPLDLSLLFDALIGRRSLHAFRTGRPFCDIGTPDRYREFDQRLGTAVGGEPARC